MIRKRRDKIDVEKGSSHERGKKQEDNNKKLLLIGCLGTMLMLMQLMQGLNASESVNTLHETMRAWVGR